MVTLGSDSTGPPPKRWGGGSETMPPEPWVVVTLGGDSACPPPERWAGVTMGCGPASPGMAGWKSREGGCAPLLPACCWWEILCLGRICWGCICCTAVGPAPCHAAQKNWSIGPAELPDTCTMGISALGSHTASKEAGCMFFLVLSHRNNQSVGQYDFAIHCR